MSTSDPVDLQKQNLWIKAFIFDMDGVVVDTTHYHYLSWKHAIKPINFDFKIADNERLRGMSRYNALEIILDMAGQVKSNKEKKALCELKNKSFLDFVENMSHDDLMPGILSFLKRARGAGFQTGMGSGSRNARLIVDKMQLNSYFDVIVDGNDINSGKPDPEVFLKTAELLSQKPERCLVFEDAQPGIQAAQKAGMRVVGVGNSSDLSADLVIPGFQNLNFINFISTICSEKPKSHFEKI